MSVLNPPEKMIFDAEKRTYQELNARVSYIKQEYPNRKIWSLISYSPITAKSISQLIKRGWILKLNKIESACDLKNLWIWLNSELSPYPRDKNLFHEIIHAIYGEEVGDSIGSLFAHDNRTIVEWLVRQSRARPELLKHAINSFNLQGYIYDQASYLAFHSNPVDLGSQRVFSFAKDNHNLLNKILMD